MKIVYGVIAASLFVSEAAIATVQCQQDGQGGLPAECVTQATEAPRKSEETVALKSADPAQAAPDEDREQASASEPDCY